MHGTKVLQIHKVACYSFHVLYVVEGVAALRLHATSLTPFFMATTNHWTQLNSSHSATPTP